MTQKPIIITGWVLTAILSLLMIFSAFMKFNQNEASLSQASAMGLDANTIRFIGVIEIVSLVLFIIPRTGVIGTLFLAAYFGGAIATHLEHQQPVAMAVIVQILVWVTAIIRFPEFRQRIFTNKKYLENAL
jgi:hypothetical protein